MPMPNTILCAIDFSNLHTILRSLYDEMMPLCEEMSGVAQGIAGLGALFYVAYRVWQSLARAEPIDVFPLLRPFVIGFCIMFFPTVVLGTINTVMSPIVQGTASMLEGQTLDMQKYREEKDRLEYEQMMNDPSTAYLVDDAEFDRQIDELGVTEIGTAAGMYIERGMYKVKKAIQNFFRELLEMLFQAASLTIDTIRTFFWWYYQFSDRLPSLFPYGMVFSQRLPNGYAATFRHIFGFRLPTCSVRYLQKFKS